MKAEKIEVLGLGARNIKTLDELHNLFINFEVHDVVDRISILKQAMYADKVYYTPGMSNEEILTLETDVFMTGDWR